MTEEEGVEVVADTPIKVDAFGVPEVIAIMERSQAEASALRDVLETLDGMTRAGRAKSLIQHALATTNGEQALKNVRGLIAERDALVERVEVLTAELVLKGAK